MPTRYSRTRTSTTCAPSSGARPRCGARCAPPRPPALPPALLTARRGASKPLLGRRASPAAPCCRGAPALLQRTAHSACIHPQRSDSILIYAGYGTSEPGAAMTWLTDLVLINTVRWLQARCGPAAGPLRGAPALPSGCAWEVLGLPADAALVLVRRVGAAG